MKKLILTLVIIFSVNTMFSQECAKICDMAKTCKMANKYVLSNGLIKATLYHDNGTIAQTGFYTLDNKLQGEWFSLDSKGAKTAVAYYDNGKKVGTWTFFENDTKREVTYSNSIISHVKTWEVTENRVVSNRP